MLVLSSGAGACSDLVDFICCSLLSSSQSEAGGECRNSDMRNHKYCIVVHIVPPPMNGATAIVPCCSEQNND